MPADMQNVAKVARRQHADFGAVMLDGDVGGDRGAVHDQRYVVGTDAGNVAQFAQALEHALGLVVRRAGDLMNEDAVIGLEHEVGIGPADIDAYARHESPDRFLVAAVPDPGAQRLNYADLARNIVSNVRPAQPPTATAWRKRRFTATLRHLRALKLRSLARES